MEWTSICTSDQCAAIYPPQPRHSAELVGRTLVHKDLQYRIGNQFTTIDRSLTISSHPPTFRAEEL